MTLTIVLHCPDFQSANVKKNGKKSSRKQNYFYKECGGQFIGDHALTYKGWHSELIHKILLMLVRGIGIRDIAGIERISIQKVFIEVCKSDILEHYQTIHANNSSS